MQGDLHKPPTPHRGPDPWGGNIPTCSVSGRTGAGCRPTGEGPPHPPPTGGPILGAVTSRPARSPAVRVQGVGRPVRAPSISASLLPVLHPATLRQVRHDRPDTSRPCTCQWGPPRSSVISDFTVRASTMRSSYATQSITSNATQTAEYQQKRPPNS